MKTVCPNNHIRLQAHTAKHHAHSSMGLGKRSTWVSHAVRAVVSHCICSFMQLFDFCQRHAFRTAIHPSIHLSVDLSHRRCSRNAKQYASHRRVWLRLGARCCRFTTLRNRHHRNNNNDSIRVYVSRMPCAGTWTPCRLANDSMVQLVVSNRW